MNMNREQLIRSIYSARVRGVVVPTEAFGRKIFVKTTKNDLVKQIREEFSENQVTNMRVRIDEDADLAVIEPARGRGTALPKSFIEEAKALAGKAARGRPRGSKSRSAEEGSETEKESAPAASGRGRRKRGETQSNENQPEQVKANETESNEPENSNANNDNGDKDAGGADQGGKQPSGASVH